MQLTQYKNHRDSKYLNWLRKQPCVVSGKKAQCAHHIRLGTNGGTSLKPSDYFCIPLLNEYHTTGSHALHIIGEDTFIKQFQLDINQLFIKFLKQYLIEEHETVVTLVEMDEMDEMKLLAIIMTLLEGKGPMFERLKRKPKIKEKDENYEKAKEFKREQDKKLRSELKKQRAPAKKTSFKGNEYYERAKEMKRARDKELRDQLKAAKKSGTKSSESTYNSEFKEKAKLLNAQYRKEQYQKAKAAKKKYLNRSL